MTAERQNGDPPGRVILLHGLGRTALSLARLERAVAGAGYRVQAWRYPSRRHAIAELVAQFRRQLSGWAAAGGPVHFVGHSLGAILIRAGLIDPPPFPLGRIVMIAPPNNGVRLVRTFRNWPQLAALYGRPARELASGARWLRELGAPAAEIGVIAGDRRFHPLNPTSYLNALSGNRHAHDGTVEVASARLAAMADFLVVRANHTFICNHPEVIRETVHFLNSGKFRRD